MTDYDDFLLASLFDLGLLCACVYVDLLVVAVCAAVGGFLCSVFVLVCLIVCCFAERVLYVLYYCGVCVCFCCFVSVCWCCYVRRFSHDLCVCLLCRLIFSLLDVCVFVCLRV